MSDEEPVDLRELEPPEPVDQVKPAIRRFRIRVVVFTLVFALVAAAVGIEIWNLTLQRNKKGELARDYAGLPVVGAWIYSRNCTTPTYHVGGLDVTVLQIGSSTDFTSFSSGQFEEDDWAIALLLQSAGGENGHQIAFATKPGERVDIVAIPPTHLISSVSVRARPGWTRAEAYFAVQKSLDGIVHLSFLDVHRDPIGTLTLDINELTGLGTAPSRPNDYVCPAE